MVMAYIVMDYYIVMAYLVMSNIDEGHVLHLHDHGLAGLGYGL